MAKGNLVHKLFAAGPLFLLYYLSISEIDTNLEKLFEVFSFNLQVIIIYFFETYWTDLLHYIILRKIILRKI